MKSFLKGGVWWFSNKLTNLVTVNQFHCAHPEEKPSWKQNKKLRNSVIHVYSKYGQITWAFQRKALISSWLLILY